ncbi:MAG: hypothetical protein GX085_05240 [Firmicutes bacterium]|nr:hypothetical protein [Bacillota bacterium]
MEWIWLLLVLFSVLGSLIERIEKARRKPAPPSPGSPHPPGEGRFFLDEPEEKKNPGRPGERTAREVQTPAYRRPTETMDLDDGDFVPAFWEEETTAGPKWAGEDWETQRRIEHKPSPPVKEAGREEPLLGERWQEPEAFLSALVLAQVLKRPDFRALPWQRRI